MVTAIRKASKIPANFAGLKQCSERVKTKVPRAKKETIIVKKDIYNGKPPTQHCKKYKNSSTNAKFTNRNGQRIELLLQRCIWMLLS
jgi:hypothetical protein